MEPFKNIFNEKSITKIASAIAKVDSSFDRKKFIKLSMSDLDSRELKDRVRSISNSLNECLNHSYKKNIDILTKTLVDEIEFLDKEWDGESNEKISGFLVWPYTEYVATYGKNNLDHSLNAQYEFTKRFTAEFSIRHFFDCDGDRVYKTLKVWKSDKNKHVRRLVSEGTRPKLPWGIKSNYLYANLEKTLKLIYSLGDDEEEYVRRSVANHLNDVSKIDEDLCFKYIDKIKNDWVKRHALRGLLKNGNPKALKAFGYSDNLRFKSSNLKIDKKKISEGDSLNIDFEYELIGRGEKKLLVEYIIHYKKKNGYSEKVFRLKDFTSKANEIIKIQKKVSFRKVTTRVHYSGEHFVEIQVNGKRLNKEAFKLLV